MSTVTIFAEAALATLPGRQREALLLRSTSRDPDVKARTTSILERVRQGGDAALLALAQELDGVTLSRLEVDPAECARALATLPSALRAALERAVKNLTRVHAAAAPVGFELEVETGICVGRRPDPLGTVGVYAPGGRAAYPSSVLMGAVPARVAGVRQVILCSPPGPSGLPSAVVLAAAALAGVDRVFALGGAGAVAAMAFGTETVPRVDRIVGPGNAYVAEAKLQVTGEVGMDSPAGPSELLALVDDAADPLVVAREMVAQAEHDPKAVVVTLALGEGVAAGVRRALEQVVGGTRRQDTVRAALAFRGALLTAGSRIEALRFANDFAAEHLLLAVRTPETWLPELRNQGTVFLGESASVAFGDYLTGANHVLPTGGLARFYSGLSTLDFVRWTSFQKVDRHAAARLAADVETLADAEGLHAHADAARAWGGT